MPRKPPHPNNFPEQLRRILARASQEKELIIPLSDKGKAISAKAILARFLKAIRIESEAWRKSNAQTPEPWFVQYEEYAQQTSIGDAPGGIRLFPKNRGKMALIFGEFLDKDDGESHDERMSREAAESQKRLQERLSKETRRKTPEELEEEMKDLHYAVVKYDDLAGKKPEGEVNEPVKYWEGK